MTLFKKGIVKLHSGATSSFKIDCDALTDEDVECLSYLIICRQAPFGSVIGIPNGGLRLAKQLRKAISIGCKNVLIVDDVLTTGKSMKDMRQQILDTRYSSYQIKGAVIFSRINDEIPDWIRPIFTM